MYVQQACGTGAISTPFDPGFRFHGRSRSPPDFYTEHLAWRGFRMNARVRTPRYRTTLYITDIGFLTDMFEKLSQSKMSILWSLWMSESYNRLCRTQKEGGSRSKSTTQAKTANTDTNGTRPRIQCTKTAETQFGCIKHRQQEKREVVTTRSYRGYIELKG